MTAVHLKNTFAYHSTYNGRFSRYEGYKRMWLQLDGGPDINMPVPSDLQYLSLTMPIMHSTLIRASNSAIFWANVLDQRTLFVRELNEIKFDLSTLVSEEEYARSGGVIVRQRFLEAFIADTLFEKRDIIKLRIDAMMKQIKQRSTAERNEILLISHSFLMKVWETYLKYPNLFSKPELLATSLLPENRLYAHGTGFDFTI